MQPSEPRWRGVPLQRNERTVRCELKLRLSPVQAPAPALQVAVAAARLLEGLLELRSGRAQAQAQAQASVAAPCSCVPCGPRASWMGGCSLPWLPV